MSVSIGNLEPFISQNSLAEETENLLEVLYI